VDSEKKSKPDAFSVLELVALEVESFTSDFRAALLQLDVPEKVGGLCAIIMFWAGFLPWFSPSSDHTQLGLDGFATPHFGTAVFLLLMLNRLARQRGQKKATLEDGRIALAFLGLGLLSSLTCIALLTHLGGLVVVKYGFYIVLVSGMGVSACGIAKLR